MSFEPRRYRVGKLLLIDVDVPVVVTEEDVREWYRTQWTNGKKLAELFDPDENEEHADLLDEFLYAKYEDVIKADGIDAYMSVSDVRDRWREEDYNYREGK